MLRFVSPALRAALRTHRAAAAAGFLGFTGLASPTVALEVTSTSPAPYALDVAATLTQISVTFDAAITPPPATAFRVFGTMSGLHSGAVQAAGNTLTFTRTEPWITGEVVHVNLHRDLTDGATTLDGGHYFAFTIASAPGAARWTEPDIYVASEVPYFIYGGDLDEDGTPDVAAPNEGTDDVSVWFNQGDGSFGPRVDSGVGAVPSCIVGEDFNNDGLVDLATADIAGGTVSIKMNTGGGVLAAAQTLAAGTTTRQVVAGDFDGDNDPDLAATSSSTSEIFVWDNQGGGTYVRSTLPTNPQNAFALDTGDFDLDGDLDLAVAAQAIDSVAVYLNQGNFVFTEAGRYKCGDGPWDLRGQDMDGDGDYDLVLVASFGNRLQVLYNDGTGAFPTKTGVNPGFFPLGVYVADVDGDGAQDVISSNFNGGSATVWLNLGDGTLTFNATLPVDRTGSYAWAHDLDLDGDLDISVVDEIGDWLYVFFNDPAVGSPHVAGLPQIGAFLAARPNPVAASGTSTLLVHGIGPEATVELYDAGGRLVRRVHEGRLPKGGLVRWDGRNANGALVPAGTYFARARGADGMTVSTKVQRLR